MKKTIIAIITAAALSLGSLGPASASINSHEIVYDDVGQQVAILTIIMCILIPGCAGGNVAFDDHDLGQPTTDPTIPPNPSELVAANWKRALWWFII